MFSVLDGASSEHHERMQESFDTALGESKQQLLAPRAPARPSTEMLVVRWCVLRRGVVGHPYGVTTKLVLAPAVVLVPAHSIEVVVETLFDFGLRLSGPEFDGLVACRTGRIQPIQPEGATARFDSSGLA